jgi:hypothetical protein
LRRSAHDRTNAIHLQAAAITHRPLHETRQLAGLSDLGTRCRRIRCESAFWFECGLLAIWSNWRGRLPIRDDRRCLLTIRNDRRGRLPIRDERRRLLAIRNEWHGLLPILRDRRRLRAIRNDWRGRLPIRDD